MLFGHESPDLFCFYDKVKGLAVVSFRNAMTAQNVVEAELWVNHLKAQAVPIEGILCDVKGVRRIAEDLPFHVTKLPVIFVAANSHQAGTLQKAVADLETYQIAIAYEQAFKLFSDKVLENADEMMLNRIGTSIYYDEAKNCACIIYYGIINPLVTAEVYGNLARTIEIVGIENVRGSLYDFRHVIDFDNSNLNAVRRTSSNMNVNYDMSHIAVALIVGTSIQESMVRMAMKITPQEERKRIVRSFEEAHRFVDEFQTRRIAKQREE